MKYPFSQIQLVLFPLLLFSLTACWSDSELSRAPDENDFYPSTDDTELREKAALQRELEALKKSNEFAPDKVFRDPLANGSLGPKMVWIPAGSFRMGDIQGDGYGNEKPVHRVSVDRFAMGRYEVTFAEYDKFAEATGRSKPSDLGWGRGNRPVINIDWNDATTYAKWLSQQTGHTYRLPTEAEWEHAARAGTETKYWWGNEWNSNKANTGFKTKQVGSFAANSFGLYDTAGNVWEWTCSEYESKYSGKEQLCNNSANLLSLRGGEWNDVAGRVGSADRIGRRPADRGVLLGLRVVMP